MKKFIVAAIALVSMSAFADHTGRHMVTISGWEDTSNVTSRSLDINYSNSAGVKTENLALNYAYAFTDAWQVGVNYKKFKKTTQGDVAAAGDDTQSYGIQVIYNFAGQLIDTNYLALHYDMAKSKDSKASAASNETKSNTWALEFGHRFSLGTLWSMNFNWSPSLTVGVQNTDPDAGSKTSNTYGQLNVLKVDVIF
jgi:hypothetical protein